MPGTILLLNGASSSGKSSIMAVLQDILDAPFLDAGLDKFIWMLPGRYLNRPLWDDVLGLATAAGAVGRPLISGMHRAIAALAWAGNCVLADHVLVEKEWVGECAELFCELPAYFIGVYCPLAVLEERETARRDRTLGQARAQFPLVHAAGVYDLLVDTSVHSAEACARQIQARLTSGAPPQAFRQIRRQRARQPD